jgi:hypothetical protein
MTDDRRGAEAEKLVENLLLKNGWSCMPAKHQRISTDSAEIINMEDDAVRNPDICAMRAGKTVFIEVKQFAQPVSVDVRGQDEHGIREPKFYDYIQVHQMSGVPLWLLIFETGSGVLLASKIDNVSRLPPIDDEACRDVYDELMVFFPRRELNPVNLSEVYKPDGFSFSLDTSGGEDVNSLLDGVEAEIETFQTGLGNF